MKIRVTRKALAEFTGTGAGQLVTLHEYRQGHELAEAEYRERGEDEVSMRLMRKLYGPDSPDPRKDGSITVDLTPAEAQCLYEYAEAWMLGAQDNIDPYYPEALGEFNAASALLRQIERVRQGVTS